MAQSKAKFSIGDVVHHKLFDYRGVIIDVDAEYMGTDEWYESMAMSCPPKDQPWYHVLVHESVHRTYVAERNLEQEAEPTPIDHPELEAFFEGFEGGCYVRKRAEN